MLLYTWWSVWRVVTSLLPYYKLKDEKRHANLQVSDVCSLHYDNKLKVACWLCRVVEILPSYNGLVREVKLSFRPRRRRCRAEYAPVEFAEIVGQDATEMLVVRDFQRES